MTEKELLEKIWIATYGAKFAEYRSMNPGHPIQDTDCDSYAWKIADDAVTALCYEQYVLQETNAPGLVGDAFEKTIERCREEALQIYLGEKNDDDDDDNYQEEDK